MSDHLLPHDPAIEKLLLASLVYTPSLLLTDGIMPELFYTEIHRSLFKELIRIREDYGSVPSENLPIYLADNFQTLFVDVQGLASSANPTPEIKRLTELAARRRVIAEAERTAAEAANPERPIALPDDAGHAWCSDSLSPARYFDTDPPAFEFIVPGFLAKGLVGFLFGEGGAYKSLAALWLCMQRACADIIGDSLWLGKFPVLKGKSIFFSGEDTDADLHHRVRSIAAAMHARRPEVPLEAIAREVSENCRIVPRERWVEDNELFLVDENGRATKKAEAIKKLISEFGADLAILETYSRIFDTAEIDNRLAAHAVGVMENVRDATQAGIECVAHSPKSARSEQTDVHGQNSLRGAGALADNARHGIWFKALSTIDGKNRLEIVNSKSFRCMRAEPFKVSIDYPVFTLDTNLDTKATPKVTLERQAIVQAVRKNGPMPFTSVVKAVMEFGKSEDSGKRWVRELVNLGWLEKTTDGTYIAALKE